MAASIIDGLTRFRIHWQNLQTCWEIDLEWDEHDRCMRWFRTKTFEGSGVFQSVEHITPERSQGWLVVLNGKVKPGELVDTMVGGIAYEIFPDRPKRPT